MLNIVTKFSFLLPFSLFACAETNTGPEQDTPWLSIELSYPVDLKGTDKIKYLDSARLTDQAEVEQVQSINLDTQIRTLDANNSPGLEIQGNCETLSTSSPAMFEQDDRLQYPPHIQTMLRKGFVGGDIEGRRFNIPLESTGGNWHECKAYSSQDTITEDRRPLTRTRGTVLHNTSATTAHREGANYRGFLTALIDGIQYGTGINDLPASNVSFRSSTVINIVSRDDEFPILFFTGTLPAFKSQGAVPETITEDVARATTYDLPHPVKYRVIVQNKTKRRGIGVFTVGQNTPLMFRRIKLDKASLPENSVERGEVIEVIIQGELNLRLTGHHPEPSQYGSQIVFGIVNQH